MGVFHALSISGEALQLPVRSKRKRKRQLPGILRTRPGSRLRWICPPRTHRACEPGEPALSIPRGQTPSEGHAVSGLEKNTGQQEEAAQSQGLGPSLAHHPTPPTSRAPSMGWGVETS